MKYKADIMRVFDRAACSLFAVTMAFASCQDERMAKDVASSSDAITFDAVLGDSMMTRSGGTVYEASQTISFPGLDDSLSMAISITDLSSPVDTLSEETVTRGTPVTTENLGELYPTFVVNAKEMPNNDGFTFSMTNADVSYNAAQTPKWNTATTFYWPQMTYDVDFWCYSPKTLTGYEGTRSTPQIDFTYGNITFDYEMAHDQTVSGKPADAVKQPDLLFAHQTWDRDMGPVKIHFYHALSAIRFVAGVVGNCTIKRITLTDVVTKASCVYAPATASADMFQWTLSSNSTDKHDIEQTFDAALTPNEDATVKQDVTDADGHVERTFMVIPQNFQNIKVTIDYNVNGLHDYTAELALPEFPTTQSSKPSQWLPGKMYTYIISNVGDDELYIDVEDEVVGLTKTNLQISNTTDSNVKCYIRATILGYWYKDDKIVAPWSTENGTFDTTFPTTVGVTTNNWTLGSDGYYYYKYPVYPGKLTGETDTDTNGDPLFQQYTAPDYPAVDGAQLRVQVVAQGVQWDAEKTNVTQAWGTENASYLSATDKE